MWVPHYGGLSLFNLKFLELFIFICKCNTCLTGAVLSARFMTQMILTVYRHPFYRAWVMTL